MTYGLRSSWKAVVYIVRKVLAFIMFMFIGAGCSMAKYILEHGSFATLQAISFFLSLILLENELNHCGIYFIM